MTARPGLSETRALFDKNASTYDRVNTVISLGLDARWREWAARAAVERPGARVLDAFAGTGRVGVRAAELGAKVTLADLSARMLSIARSLALARNVSVSIEEVDLVLPDLEVPGAPFDAVTVVFGVRYLEDPAAVLLQLSRLLRPGGRFVVLEFVEPERGLVSSAAARYFFHVLPSLAGALAGSRELYDWLVATTHEMDGAAHLRRVVEDAGLCVVETRMMGFGLVCGIVAALA